MTIPAQILRQLRAAKGYAHRRVAFFMKVGWVSYDYLRNRETGRTRFSYEDLEDLARAGMIEEGDIWWQRFEIAMAGEVDPVVELGPTPAKVFVLTEDELLALLQKARTLPAA